VQDEDDPATIPPNAGPDAKPSGRSALVPGFMAGVEAAHRRFGKLPFAKLFEPAIYYAENGFKLHAIHGSMLAKREAVLTRLPETRRVFTREDGKLYRLGDRFAQPSWPRRCGTWPRKERITSIAGRGPSTSWRRCVAREAR
jgi:gamma-glutamyltranspeptidase/glutathione hydrolase